MKKTLVVLMTLAAVLVGCKSDDAIQDPAPIDNIAGGGGGTTNPPGGGTGFSDDPMKNPKHKDYALLQQKTIYFDYDSDAIKQEYVPVVEAHARYLSGRPQAKLLVQGNADDRGSREYNLALGQRRADAIKSRLSLLGARGDQVESVSLGEEKPACSEPTESCYGQNRRGDLNYR